MIHALAELHFLRPWWFSLTIPMVVLWWLQRRETDTTARWRAVMDPALLAHLTIGSDRRRRLEPGDLLMACWLIVTLAIAGPTWRQVASPFAPAARPAMMVLKVTPSMLGRDLAPTRLDRAREKLTDLLALREGAPTGLIAYAGSAHLVLPPTVDGSVVTVMAGALAPDVMPRQGDALTEAVELARQVLAEGGQGGSVVVFTDTAPPIAAGHNVGAPLYLFAMLPPGRASADPALRSAADTLDAKLIAPTIDTKDVKALARRLATVGPPPPASGEAARWEEAGWWLTPLVSLMALAWFRRGWVLA